MATHAHTEAELKTQLEQGTLTHRLLTNKLGANGLRFTTAPDPYAAVREQGRKAQPKQASKGWITDEKLRANGANPVYTQPPDGYALALKEGQ